MKKNLSSKHRRRFWKNAVRICVYCGTRKNLTIDHKIARVLGGTNDDKNLAVLCEPCNKAKGVLELELHLRQQQEARARRDEHDARCSAARARAAEQRTAEFLRLMRP